MLTFKDTNMQSKAEAILKKSDKYMSLFTSQIKTKSDDMTSTFSNKMGVSQRQLTELFALLNERIHQFSSDINKMSLTAATKHMTTHGKQETMAELDEIIKILKSTKQLSDPLFNHKKLFIGLGLGIGLGITLGYVMAEKSSSKNTTALRLNGFSR